MTELIQLCLEPEEDPERSKRRADRHNFSLLIYFGPSLFIINRITKASLPHNNLGQGKDRTTTKGTAGKARRRQQQAKQKESITTTYQDKEQPIHRTLRGTEQPEDWEHGKRREQQKPRPGQKKAKEYGTARNQVRDRKVRWREN